MNFTCNECNDSGSRDKLGTYLDCNACGTAATRRDLNDFVKSLGPTHPEDVALAIHQRALAMAPKQEVINVENERVAFDAWYDVTPSRHAYALDAWKHRASIAAPAAANGAQYLTRIADFLADAVGGYSGGLADRIEEVIKQLRLDAGCGACGDACKGMTCGLQDESPSAVAAGSDAALVDAKQLVDITTAIMSQHGLIDHLSIGATQAFCDDLCAALSGAKGN